MCIQINIGGDKMVNVRCRTNLDDYTNERWPEVMAVRPVKGDIVQSEGGQILSVVDVTHAVAGNLHPTVLQGEPYLIVELHKRIYETLP